LSLDADEIFVGTDEHEGQRAQMFYKDRFKAQMVKRMLTPGGPSQAELSKETGVPQPTLSRWKHDAATIEPMAKVRKKTAGPPKRRGRERTPAEKLQLVLEAAKLSDEQLGAFLREHGVFEAELLEWRQKALDGLSAEPAVRPATPAEVKRARELERELRRKDKALAEAAALIVLKKKVQQLWGDEDDDTDPRSDE